MDCDPRSDPPAWWEWPLSFTPHVESRMEERQFAEVELRTMLMDATRVVSARRPGRFLVTTRQGREPGSSCLNPTGTSGYFSL